MRKHKAVIGRAEVISFPDLDIDSVHAKVDTGAHRSSIDASNINESDGVLSYTLFREGSPHFTGQVLTSDKYRTVEIFNSFGEGQTRFQISLTIKVAHKKITTTFTLADRSKKLYPILLGRKLLKDRFLVDVAEGEPSPDDRES